MLGMRSGFALSGRYALGYENCSATDEPLLHFFNRTREFYIPYIGHPTVFISFVS